MSNEEILKELTMTRLDLTYQRECMTEYYEDAYACRLTIASLIGKVEGLTEAFVENNA
jgi:hypothetical protein